MSIRRLQYQVDYFHIITFKEEYRKAVAPYFSFEDLEYGIDNENTIHEGIKLIFKNEQIAFFLRKDSVILLFEGDVNVLKNQNGVIKTFWELYEKAKSFYGYTKTVKHTLVVHAVDIREKEEIKSLLENPPYLKENPFGKLDEFSCVYEFKKNEIDHKFQVGNFTPRDIKIHDLTPFKSEFNQDLTENVGLMGRLELTEIDKNPSFSKFKSLVSKSEEILSSFNLIKDEK
jgi:hypothetical protein